MSSVQFHFFRLTMRVLHRIQARFPTQDVDAFVVFRRRADRVADLAMRPPPGVTVRPATIDGVGGDWLIPAGAPQEPAIVFLHGGGTFYGWGSPHRRMVGHLARFAGLCTFGVDYRLMPEYTYPAAHDDCYAVYQAFVQAGKQVVLIGESSGGVLALAAMLRAREAGLPQPALCVLISPVVDYGFRDGRIWQSDDPFLHPGFAVGMHRYYVAGHDPTSPDLAPVYADLSGLAPLLIWVAEHDLLRGEAERLADAARQHGVETHVTIWPRVWHAWHVLAPQLPEATQALKALGQAIRQRVA
jgi:monoterpene epsilon-lactone hydrolase